MRVVWDHEPSNDVTRCDDAILPSVDASWRADDPLRLNRGLNDVACWTQLGFLEALRVCHGSIQHNESHVRVIGYHAIHHGNATP